MNLLLALDALSESDKLRAGGKAVSLARLNEMGFPVPESLCVTTAAYDRFVEATGLRERILLELNRKSFKEMRWEEIWDASLRIRNLFLLHPFPEDLEGPLRKGLGPFVKGISTAVRSSAPEEDAAVSSFAGVHESFVHVRGLKAVLECIRKVWASLWSDAALLYRQELGLEVEKSSMAVLVQKVVDGERSGVTFSKNPNAETEAVVESVWGLNLGLVDGAVEPDRWIFDRLSRKCLRHLPASRERFAAAGKQETVFKKLPKEKAQRAPLSGRQAKEVLDAALKLESDFGSPQDVEWTFKKKTLFLLQARPITTLSPSREEDQRPWYLSLHRSFENLKALRTKIEKEYIPEMIREAKRLESETLNRLSDSALADAIEHRMDVNDRWVSVYWKEFIPFAHGIRLFGQTYNDAVRPENPYEFMDLLGSTPMVSLERNRMLEEMAQAIRKDPALRQDLVRRADSPRKRRLLKKVSVFTEQFGDLSCPVTGGTQCGQGEDTLVKILLELSDHPPLKPKSGGQRNSKDLQRAFLQCFPPRRKAFARDLLDLARASYRLRDDDNIYLGKIEAQLLRALEKGIGRLKRRKRPQPEASGPAAVIDALRGKPPARASSTSKPEAIPEKAGPLRARQLVGQPAGPGISRGKARVILETGELSNFKHGEILVCDAVDPNMTFVVPLAGGIVERRGGMLIHGAIIAREYGLPCVTGIPDATTLIRSGDIITVDGYLGIVTVDQPLS